MAVITYHQVIVLVVFLFIKKKIYTAYSDFDHFFIGHLSALDFVLT